jgi:hypothetical protein
MSAIELTALQGSHYSLRTDGQTEVRFTVADKNWITFCGNFVRPGGNFENKPMGRQENSRRHVARIAKAMPARKTL